MYKALVVCLENWDTLQEVPFVLSKAGCAVDVYCSKESWLLKNSFYHNWIESSSDFDKYKNELFRLALDKDAGYNWIVLGDEKLLKLMNDHVAGAELFEKILPLTKMENRELLGSKEGLSDLCIKYGIPTPGYHVYNHEPDFSVDKLGLNYPLLLKQDLSWGGGGIDYCADKAALQNAINKTGKEFSYIIQEFIRGKDIGIEAFYDRGILLNYNAGEVIGYSKSQFTFTTKRHYFLNSRLEKELKKLGADFGINGFASIQVIYQQSNDTYYFLEADLRPNFWVPSGRFTGQDFSQAIRKKIDPSYQIPQNTRLQEGETMEISIFYRDMSRCFRQKDFKGFFSWVFNRKGYWKFIPTYDGKLFRTLLYELFVKKLANKFKR
ncbi:MAG: hypothetical protein RLZZ28_210 [Bacteroidota bacterium]